MTKAFRVWLGIAAGLAALSMSITIFFFVGPYVLNSPSALKWLHLVTFVCALHAVVTFTIWVYRTKLRRKGAQDAFIVTVIIVMIIASLFFWGAHFEEVRSLPRGRNAPVTIEHSPNGAHQLLVYYESSLPTSVRATRVVNRWMFVRTPFIRMGDQSDLLGWPEFVITWESNYRAEVQVWYGQIQPQPPIIVEFPQ
ncbi:MAG: hypothetical protein FWD06_07710 [Oscillospiraceae bacterium]|nr:hypothetical protein [Oscillospiraceae bacterium]